MAQGVMLRAREGVREQTLYVSRRVVMRMTSEIFNEVGKEMAAARMWIPEVNRKKFDTETKSFHDAMRTAETAERFNALLDQWRSRAEWLRENPRASAAPPCLARQFGESNDQYMERCYQAGGFYAEQ